jgi:hypothetical protein
MPEDSNVLRFAQAQAELRTSFYRKGNRERITVSPRKAPRLQSRLSAKASKKLFSEMKSTALYYSKRKGGSFLSP